MNRLLRLTAVTLLIISALSFFCKSGPEDHSKNLGHPWEQYDSSCFNRFQTIQSIISYSDSCLGAHKKKSLDYYNFVAQLIRKRFYHGYSYYSFSSNPLAFLAGRFIWSHLYAIVIPDDIMKHPMAACSQQSIVLMEIFRRNKINYRKVAFPHHYTVEGFIENQWRYFDTDMEPDLSSKRESVETLERENKFFPAYANSNYKTSFLKQALETPTPGRINESPAWKVTLFHKCCALLVSKWFLFALFLFSFRSTVSTAVLKRMFKSIWVQRRQSGPVADLIQLSEKKAV